MEHLSKSEENFCETAGGFGVIATMVCLGQHLYFMQPHWLTFTIIGLYAATIVAFILLIKKSTIALLSIAICAVLILFVVLIMTLSMAFSLVLVLLFIYLVVIAAVGYSGDLQMHLKQRKASALADEMEWAGKI